MWAAVAQVHRSDGHGPGERTWACEMRDYPSTERAAMDAACEWWKQTDQSDDCDVTISIERADGTIVEHRIRVGMVLTASRVPTGQKQVPPPPRPPENIQLTDGKPLPGGGR